MGRRGEIDYGGSEENRTGEQGKENKRRGKGKRVRCGREGVREENRAGGSRRKRD
jgi:hypothetical protein